MKVLILLAFAVMLRTALSQQSSSTCTGLDSLIANRNLNFTGSCTRNNDCNMVNCVPGDGQSLIITFPQSPDSACSVRTQVAVEDVNFDETANATRVVNVQVTVGDGTTAELPITLSINFSPSGNVQYGISFALPGDPSPPTTVFQLTNIPIQCTTAPNPTTAPTTAPNPTRAPTTAPNPTRAPTTAPNPTTGAGSRMQAMMATILCALLLTKLF